MRRTRVKICGITNAANARQAVDLGADALGFNLYQASSRYVEIEQLKQFFNDVPPFTQRVGLFVNEDAAIVKEALKAIAFDILQFHGAETVAYCESFGVPYIKAIRAGSREDILKQAAEYHSAAAILVDSVKGEQFGGTGVTFDWSMIPGLEQPLILAGGLNANNVSQAIEMVAPYAVDVSGGVESSSGVKDPELMKQFFDSVHAADLTNK
jgi:phosphoribosylanthranilate isomerase